MTHTDQPAARATAVELAAGSVDAVARRVVELLAESPPPPRKLLTAAEVAARWGIERAWVYAHADDLGARRLGAGERPRLRFDPDEVERRLATLDRRGRSASAAPSVPRLR